MLRSGAAWTNFSGLLAGLLVLSAPLCTSSSLKPKSARMSSSCGGAGNGGGATPGGACGGAPGGGATPAGGGGGTNDFGGDPGGGAGAGDGGADDGFPGTVAGQPARRRRRAISAAIMPSRFLTKTARQISCGDCRTEAVSAGSSSTRTAWRTFKLSCSSSLRINSAFEVMRADSGPPSRLEITQAWS